MRQFTDTDVQPWLASDNSGRILIGSRDELVDAPLWYHKKGLQQTASGYGSKLTSRYKINFNGKYYRLYTTIYSNSGYYRSTWFKVKGRTIYVD